MRTLPVFIEHFVGVLTISWVRLCICYWNLIFLPEWIQSMHVSILQDHNNLQHSSHQGGSWVVMLHIRCGYTQSAGERHPAQTPRWSGFDAPQPYRNTVGGIKNATFWSIRCPVSRPVTTLRPVYQVLSFPSCPLHDNGFLMFVALCFACYCI